MAPARCQTTASCCLSGLPHNPPPHPLPPPPNTTTTRRFHPTLAPAQRSLGWLSCDGRRSRSPRAAPPLACTDLVNGAKVTLAYLHKVGKGLRRALQGNTGVMVEVKVTTRHTDKSLGEASALRPIPLAGTAPGQLACTRPDLPIPQQHPAPLAPHPAERPRPEGRNSADTGSPGRRGPHLLIEDLGLLRRRVLDHAAAHGTEGRWPPAVLVSPGAGERVAGGKAPRS